jgi:L-rhamnose isomerase
MASPRSDYESAREIYSALGVDTDAALERLTTIPVSLHCWQGDDVGGFENSSSELGAGLAVTGNYPGRARTIDELRADVEKALSLIPGKHRLSLHACYADLGGKKVERNQYGVEQFQSWIDWARANGLGLDFNPTYFAHPLAADGQTLSHRDSGIRTYWVEHGIVSREIAAEMGRQLGNTCVTNFWIPDGSKDTPADRNSPRVRLRESLDAIFSKSIDPAHNLDALESKLFGIGSESYVVGSHEFYLGYAIQNQKLICLDSGHFHPTETLADKVSAVLQWVPRLLLHVSRGVRWDSDHVVVLDDPTRALMEELIRGDFLGRTHIGLDFFDASINRIAAWVIGTRNTVKALLFALLQPHEKLIAAEAAGDHTARLALFEEARTLPFHAVWTEYCNRQNVPAGPEWLAEVQTYERDVLARRN